MGERPDEDDRPIYLPSDVEAVSDGTGGGQQPLLPCGGQVMVKVNEVNTLFSPGYPQSYPSDLHCIWNVKAPPGYKVVGQFVEFDLTNSDDCSSDYVQISGLSAMRDSNEQEVKRHCGKTAPADFLDGDSAVETSHVTCGEVSSTS